ncbi:ABC transporter transmembrane domain-containing protein [Chitinimonas koreensis]|uniref:ABC transporter transmembrane domain-containing protein n=1 Tax=Chitinimonas koreensis TaxID=356302 RepID=UPI00165454AA|nr:ABC transporter transmembrane domain-containing protein [Chitinimonas koreensis]QNM97010.1 hypothetical protein H9L41_01305 [Chitinimonas koreensis]
MRIVRFLAAASPLALAGAALAGMLGGAALAGAIGMIDRLLADGGWRSLGQGPQGLAYLAGALAVGGLTYLSGSLVAGLMQRRLAGLRQQLCERILATELVRLEKLGGAALLTLLSDDLNRLAQGAAALPVLVIDLSICLAILAYIAVLSPALFLLVAGGQALTLLAMAVFFGRYETRLRAAQPGRQALMQCFQLLVGATKPLKQRQALRDAFLDQLYRPTVQQVMRDADRCNSLGVGMDSVAKVAFLLAVGSILLAAAWLPAWPAARRCAARCWPTCSW